MEYDFRSDTVTRPSAEMRSVMAAAEVGDDVLGDDPTVTRLEGKLAEMLQMEAAVFMPSGTQSNLAALMAHCERGDEYIAGQQAHCYVNEAGGAAVLASIQPQPLNNQPDGTIALSEIERAIKPDDAHFARTRLLALENTIGGKILPADYVGEALALARRHGLGCHLDGARLFNAAVGSGQEAAELVRGFDSVSVCLSKGLGAPVGSVLVGQKDLIKKARRHRKILGGGLRQAGILAAAGVYALDHNIDRLAEDHANAQLLAKGLSQFDALKVAPAQTNMVFVEVAEDVAQDFATHLASRGVKVLSNYAGRSQRWVLHMDVDKSAVEATLGVIGQFFAA